MKKFEISVVLFCGLTLLPGISAAQTITIDSVSGTSFCMGDSVSVTFTATGSWGDENIFILQLSDASGSFSSTFQNVVSIRDNMPGTFTIDTTIPEVGESSNYRFRVIGSIPYTTSANNSSDISIGTGPNVSVGTSMTAASIGTPITFQANAEGNALPSASWNFGPGASPAIATTNGIIDIVPDIVKGKSVSDTLVSFSQDVAYSTPGDKKITVTVASPGGCSTTEASEIHIYDCTNPVIPHDAIVIDSTGTVTENRKTYWVNPGFTLYPSDYDTVFAEPGSLISSNAGYDVIYLKKGSAMNWYGTSNAVIFGNGVSINIDTNANFILNCSNLDFNYSDAPPNPAFPAAGVDMDAAAQSISIMPNPTNGNISITGIPQGVKDISVLNVLGYSEMEIAKPNSDMQIDLSTLSSGVYYVRIAMQGTVVTKKIVKE